MTKPFENSNVCEGYRIDDRATFKALASAVLVERASMYPGDLVLWDPQDGNEGWLICHDRRDVLVQDFELFVVAP